VWGIRDRNSFNGATGRRIFVFFFYDLIYCTLIDFGNFSILFHDGKRGDEITAAFAQEKLSGDLMIPTFTTRLYGRISRGFERTAAVLGCLLACWPIQQQPNPLFYYKSLFCAQRSI
jgi:hypothetical protein